MHFGITESQTREILEAEMGKTGLVGGDGLVLFGGKLSRSICLAELICGRECRYSAWRRIEPKVKKERYDPD